MKCSKCGEEYKENQAFCLKCGNPIQVVPDFNLIEAELASNIGELMDSMEEEPEKENPSQEEMQVNEPDISNMELKLVDISRKDTENNDNDVADGKTKIIGNINLPPQDEIEEDYIVELEIPKEANGKKSKGKIALIVFIVIFILAVAITAFIFIAKSVKNTATTYDEFFNNAKTAYEKMDTDTALDNAKHALDKADTKEDKMAVRQLIYNIQVLAGDKGDYYAENLEELINLGTTDKEHFLSLAKYYDENKKYSKLTELLRNTDNEEIRSALSEYVVEEPKADLESGDYNEYIAVNLTAKEGYTIYFTTDSRSPSNYGEIYSEPITLKEEGEKVIKAIAVNEKGVESNIVTFTYNIKLTGSGAPVLIPAGGAYTDYTIIKVEVPEGGKAYYTWDASNPTSQSEEYDDEKGIEMLRGINILKVLVIDKYGIESEVANESYNLQIARVINANEAISLVQTEAEKTAEEGITVTASYETLTVIDNQEYYIILASYNDESETDTDTIIYAVNTYDKSLKKAIDENGKYSIEEEETE